ncbi:protealysin inhibitor emfourin [Microbacterium deminutum]|uniref:protealysin inhibitor emfourin n=1 Tax=Microbacterium deminutum TaxID=344164 RepID=UPI0031D91034
MTVVRTGGFAGLRREWRAEPDDHEASHWVTLIEECPWDAVAIGRRVTGADLFMWRLDARCGGEKREAELADPDVQGPWRDLIDAVREAGAPRPATRD